MAETPQPAATPSPPRPRRSWPGALLLGAVIAFAVHVGPQLWQYPRMLWTLQRQPPPTRCQYWSPASQRVASLIPGVARAAADGAMRA